MASEHKPITVTEGRVSKGGQNPTNESGARPKPPDGSGGKAQTFEGWFVYDSKGQPCLDSFGLSKLGAAWVFWGENASSDKENIERLCQRGYTVRRVTVQITSKE